VTDHRSLPQYDTLDDETEFEELYQKGNFSPLNTGVGGEVVQNCWEGKYESMGEGVNDLKDLKQWL
jgi:hypothetical protein